MEPLLISIAHAAEMLGGVSVRHVYRLIQNENLPVVQLGKRKKAIPLKDLKEWIDRRKSLCYDSEATGTVARNKENKPCHTAAKTRSFGGRPTPTQAARELGNLLGL